MQLICQNKIIQTIKIAKFDLEQSKKDVEISKSDLKPTASLSLEKSYANDLSSTVDQSDKDILKATVSWPFYTGGKTAIYYQ
jgi:outer membrane protein